MKYSKPSLTFVLLFFLSTLGYCQEKSQTEDSKADIVITKKDIQQSTYINLAQLLNSQNGILVTNAYGNPSSEKRIFIEGALGRHVLILLDGSPVFNAENRVAFLPQNHFDILNIPLLSIESIEIVKGGQSILHGSYGAAGIISIKTIKTPDAPIGLDVSRSFGTFDSPSTRISLSTSKKSKIGLGIAYTEERSKGIDEKPGDTDPFFLPQMLDLRNGFLRNSFSSVLNIYPLKKLSVSSFYYYSGIDRRLDGFQITDQKNTLSNSGTRVQFRTNKWLVNANYTYSKSNEARNSRRSSSTEVLKFKNLHANGTYTFFDRLSITSGLARQFIIGHGFSNSPGTSSRSAWIPYTLIRLASWRNLTLETGTRRIYIDPGFSDENYFTHRASVSYMFFKHFIVSSSYSKQFYNDSSIEDSYYFDAGLRVQVLKNDVLFSVRYINHDISRENSFLTYEKTLGWDVSLAWTVNKYLSFKSYYNNFNGIFEDPENNVGAPFNPILLQVPRHRLTSSMAINPTREWLLNVETIYTGDRKESASAATLDSYMLVNLYGEYSRRDTGLTIFFQVRNLLDENFIERTDFSIAGITTTGGIRYSFNNR